MATENNEWKLSVRVRFGTHWFLQLQTSYRSAQGGVVGRGCHRLSSTEPAVERAGFQGSAPGSLAISSSWTKLVVFFWYVPLPPATGPHWGYKASKQLSRRPRLHQTVLGLILLSQSFSWVPRMIPLQMPCSQNTSDQYPDVSQVFGITRGQWHANESREMPSCQTSSKDSFQWYYPIALTFEKLLF